jgi:hypothetical protein
VLLPLDDVHQGPHHHHDGHDGQEKDEDLPAAGPKRLRQGPRLVQVLRRLEYPEHPEHPRMRASPSPAAMVVMRLISWGMELRVPDEKLEAARPRRCVGIADLNRSESRGPCVGRKLVPGVRRGERDDRHARCTSRLNARGRVFDH